MVTTPCPISRNGRRDSPKRSSTPVRRSIWAVATVGSMESNGTGGARSYVNSADSPITRCATRGATPENSRFGASSVCSTVAGDQVTGMEFVPLVLNEGAELFEANDRTEFLRRRGMSEVATGVMADSILGRFQELSEAYGTPVVVREGRGFVGPPGR